MYRNLPESVLTATLLLLFTVSCGSGGSGGGEADDDDGEMMTVVGGESMQTSMEVEVPPEQPPTPPMPAVDSFSFIFDDDFRANNTDGFLELLEETIGKSVEPLNTIPNIFNNTQLPVFYGNCGFANAFYSPADREIVLCDELTETAFNFFVLVNEATGDDAFAQAILEATSMMTFVLYHEVGHALDDITGLAVGGNFESVADAIGTVLAVRTDQPLAPILGALFFLQNTEGSFADVHNSGADRAGDLLCWTLGSSSRLTETFSGIASDLVQSGRDCVSEYADQLEFVTQLIPNVRDLPPVGSLAKESVDEDGRLKAMDKLLSELMQGKLRKL